MDVDLKAFDVSLLVSLESLLRLQSVTKAAQELNVTQPALSRRLKSLREVFQDPLLAPADGGRAMVLTARAEALLAPLSVALQQLQQAISPPEPFDPTSHQRTFHIMATDYAALVFGLPLVTRLATLAPGIRVGLRNYDRHQVLPLMDEGQLDLLIGSEGMTPSTLQARKLSDERFVLAQRHHHPRGQTPLDLDAFCRLRFVLLSLSGGAFSGGVDESLLALGRTRTVVSSVQQFTLIPRLLAQSDLVSVLPERLAQAHPELDIFELPLTTRSFSLMLSWHARYQADDAHRFLRNQLVDLAD